MGPVGASRGAPDLPHDPLVGHDTYETVKVLNRGAFGVVVLAKDKQEGEHYALKFIERGPQTVSRYVEREVVNHMKLRHPHVISLHEVFLTQDYLVLVMEYAAGGDLFSLVRRSGGLPEADARWYFQQIIVAVDYCHKLGVCSRDIKLENTLLDGSARPLVKLCDFGFSKDANYHSAPGSRVGTPAYLAPEVITADESTRYDGKCADVWSCGVLLYVMVCGAYPFRRSGDEANIRPTHRLDVLLQRIKNVDYGFPANKNVSPELKSLIRRMLVADPAQRATILEIMQHPWYQVGLSPEVLSFNDDLVRRSLAEPVTAEMEQEIHKIVEEAAVKAGRRGVASDEAGGGSGGSGMGGSASEYLDDVDALLRDGDSTNGVGAMMLEQI